MDVGAKVSCILCHRSEETVTTGALSNKDQVTAHQNCLLYSSGLYCENSPLSDDLFGFSVQDVLDEVKRGRKLNCNKCKRKGATAGCEVRSCSKSYHYPCAVQRGAKIIEDPVKGKYGLFCFKHHEQPQRAENDGLVNGLNFYSPKAGTSKSLNRAGSSKVYCLACEKTEGNIRSESLSNTIIMLSCDQHAPSSHQRNVNDDPAVAGPSGHSSAPSGSSTHLPSKRRLSVNDKQEMSPSKRKREGWARRISDISSSDENEPNTQMEIFAPLESDLEESANSAPEHQLHRTERVSPTEPPSGINLEDESTNKDEDEITIHSDNESQSLLPPVVPPSSALTPPASSPARTKVTLVWSVGREDQGFSPKQNPVHSPDQQTAGPSVPRQTSAVPPPSPDRPRARGDTGTGSAISPAPPETASVALVSSAPSPAAPPIDPEEPSVDSPSFWRSCNAAGCTRAIFTHFINEMNDISNRIQSDQASQEDYDRALRVMAASGKLEDLVAEQQKELQQKQMELTKAAAAMSKVVSALRR
uniref:PHD-type domain-containing protein n=1 Tax=Scophthalmus maximus TaxID=52904 RepID=A0A8D2ZHB3_SCOMX